MVAGMRVQTLFDLTGRAAIVTGGGTHLGRAMAETLGELVASGWLTEKQLRPGGWSLLYAATSDSTFQIDVAQRP